MDTLQFWTWLAGLSDGEACFSVTHTGGASTAYGTHYFLALRADDWRVLHFAQQRAGVGSLRQRPARGTSKPAVAWEVRGYEDSIALRDGLNLGGGLQSKKALDFALWSEAVDLIHLYGGGKHSTAGPRLAELKAELHAVKPYSEERAEGYQQFNGKGFVKGIDPEVARAERVNLRRARSARNLWASEAAQDMKLQRQRAYSKLSQADIDDIVVRVAAGERRAEIAAQYGISIGLISKFVSGKYLRRDGTLALVENEPGLKPTDPAFWKSEAGLRLLHKQATTRGKLSQNQIDELVERYNSGKMTQSALAQEYGVSRPLVGKFVKGDYIRRV